MNEEVKIPMSIKKSILSIIGCLIFIGFSIWFIIDPQQFLNFRRQNETTIFIVGIIGLITFSIFLIFITYKLFQKNTGIHFNKDGFFDNSNATSAGFVKWEDVLKIEEAKVANQKFVLILVKNPEDYVKRQKSLVKRKLMASNMSFYESPIMISANHLQINYDKLLELMKSQFEKYNLITT